MDAEVEKTADELRQIERILTEIIGRPSRWSGRVELTDDPQVLGKKPLGCDIIINRNLLGRDERWRTLIHELLHSYSAGYNSADYWASRGWEEGVVEWLQRLLRPVILGRLGLSISEAVFDAAPEHPLYSEYVSALGNLQAIVGQGQIQFYLDLLAAPIRDRSAAVYGLGRTLPASEYRPFVRVFAAGNAVLRKER